MFLLGTHTHPITGPMQSPSMTAAAFAASLGLLAVSHRRCGRLASRLQSLDRTARRVPSSFAPRASSSSSSSSSGARVPAPVAPPCLDERSSLPSKVKVALCQLPVGEDKRLNIANARAAIEDAAKDGAALVVLPEMWNCPYSNDSFAVYAETIGPAPGRWTGGGTHTNGAGTGKGVTNDDDDEDEDEEAESVAMLSEVAAKLKVVLVGGSIPERCATTGALYNTCCVFDSDGTLLGKHRKTHLFDIDIPGEITFKESDTLRPGTELTVVDTAVGRVGVGICFDIRFPELAMACANRGAAIMVYPGAFNTVTGPPHWELLQRARAVDNQMFVLTCSPARVPGAAYQAWGHSTAVGPWAEIIGTTDEKPGRVTCELDMEQVRIRRRNMPLEKQRRGDVYQLRDVGAAE